MLILVAEDEVTILVTLRDALEDAGHSVLGATDTMSALKALEADPPPEIVVTDVRMPGKGGLAILERSMELDDQRPVLLMTGYATVDDAVAAMKLGAVDYVQKPFRNEAVVRRIETLGKVADLAQENRELREQLETVAPTGFDGIVGASDAMRKVFDRVQTVARTEATVEIEGESGTGKERIARAVHTFSARKDGPFIALGCGALPPNLLEAELFGHEKGAFTDAKSARKGRVELADGGTLFLDDIDDMPMPLQVKLLRVLQEHQFERVGGEATLSSDFRVVVATKVPLRGLVKEGKFREDLYYRIHVVPIGLPPLRERRGDVPLLVQAMIDKYGGGRAFEVQRSTMQMLERYAWPGNVRELENAVQRAVALAGDSKRLEAEDLLPQDGRFARTAEVQVDVRPLREILKETEVEHIKSALVATGGHRSQTAELLGISRKVLWEKLRDYGIDGDEPEAS